MSTYTQFVDGSQASFGGDEFIFVEVATDMDLEATLRVIALTDAVSSAEISGVTDICPAHVSYMVRVDPDIRDPREVLPILEEIHKRKAQESKLVIESRIIEMPILYQDPWSHDVLMRFRDRHQDPNASDLEYCARINGFASVDEFIGAHSSRLHIATFVAFMPGNAECYQLVPKDQQLEAPKYVRPRTDTPDRALGFGGAFSTIYPVQGAGGFQLLGRCAVPVYEAQQSFGPFEANAVLPKGGDIFQYRPIDMGEYEEIRLQVEAGTYKYRIGLLEFDLSKFREDPIGYPQTLAEALP